MVAKPTPSCGLLLMPHDKMRPSRAARAGMVAATQSGWRGLCGLELLGVLRTQLAEPTRLGNAVPQLLQRILRIGLGEVLFRDVGQQCVGAGDNGVVAGA